MLMAVIAISASAPVGAVPNAGERMVSTGVATVYHPSLHGHKTASGEPYDRNAMTAAHNTLPLGSRVRVTNLNNHRQVVVRINDRGPMVAGRIIDLSGAAAVALGMESPGLMRVRLERLPAVRD
jgi:rare lipoprotein A